MNLTMNIAKNLQNVQNRISRAAAKYHRPEASIHLLAVSKTKPVELLKQAYDAGQRWFGENYLQEALPKIHALQHEPNIEFHFIGEVQSNKATLIAENFAWVHSIYREKTAERLNSQRSEQLPPLNVCIEVNVSQEDSKSGIVDFEHLYQLAQFIQTKCPRLMLRGLMTIPHLTHLIKAQRRSYATLKHFFEALKKQGIPLDTLSMGMSNDLEAAIAEGATIVRVGQAIFGER
jgi:PLP dependent protein